MSNGPKDGYPIVHVRGRTKIGNIIEPIHYAYGDGDGLMPAFIGWFIPSGRYADGRPMGHHEVFPVEWQPLRATYELFRPEEPVWPKDAYLIQMTFFEIWDAVSPEDRMNTKAEWELDR
jgi:hypothetical protein